MKIQLSEIEKLKLEKQHKKEKNSKVADRPLKHNNDLQKDFINKYAELRKTYVLTSEYFLWIASILLRKLRSVRDGYVKARKRR